jgi:hypothetical protein
VPPQPKRQRGRPKKGEVVENEPRRLERQATMWLAEMLNPRSGGIGKSLISLVLL